MNTHNNLTNDEVPTRHWSLSGTYSLRDLGGYSTTDGRRTKWRTFLRADSLHRMSAEAKMSLIDIGLHTIVDF